MARKGVTFLPSPRDKVVTIRAAIATIATCTTLLAAIGGGVGWVIGTCAPGYYRAVFRGGTEPWFDPVSVGVGQGLGQGTAGGVVVGIVVVALFLWKESRRYRLSEISKNEAQAGDW